SFISGNASGHVAGKRGILAGAGRGPRPSISAEGANPGMALLQFAYLNLRHHLRAVLLHIGASVR
ncbi:MAG TPA: hypothetical protein VII34_07225, partial [Pyrinomonadaceae bacterium]